MSLEEVVDRTPSSKPKRKVVFSILAFCVILALIFLGFSACNTGSTNGAGAEAALASTSAGASTPSPTPTSAPDCPAEFVQKTPDRGDLGRYIATGIKDDKEALALLGHDVVSLIGAAKAFGVEVPSDTSTLVTTDKSCLSREGQDLYVGVKAIMTAKGTEVNNNDQVPTDYTNSGVTDDQIVYAAEQGITGNRSATSWTWTRDGVTYVVYVMHRCGNWPMLTPPSGHPTGKTDNPPPPEEPPTKPPLDAKVPSQSSGSEGGRATDGKGVNDDPSSGAYTPPTKVTQPPAAPRTDPAPPTPVVPEPRPSTPSNPDPRPVPTPDPDPAPEPEPSAPTEPVTAPCDPAPGEETC